MGHQGLLPETSLGVLSVQVETPFQAGGAAIEIWAKVVITVVVPRLIRASAIKDPRGAAPNRRTAAVAVPGCGHGARTPRFNLVFIPINGPVVAAVPPANDRVLQVGTGTGQSQTGPAKVGVRGSRAVNDLTVLFNVPGVVPIRDGHYVGRGLGWVGVKHHEGFTHAGIRKGPGGVSGLTPSRPTARDPSRLDPIPYVVKSLGPTDVTYRRPRQDPSRGSIAVEIDGRSVTGRIGAIVVLDIKISRHGNGTRGQSDSDGLSTNPACHGVIQTDTGSDGFLGLRITRSWITRGTTGIGDLAKYFLGKGKG